MAKEMKSRNLKVYGQSGYRYHETPAILLKGKWLGELGFNVGDYISIVCENGKLVITPDVERARAEAEEKDFMEKEMQALRKRYKLEKANAKVSMVAEPGARW